MKLRWRKVPHEATWKARSNGLLLAIQYDYYDNDYTASVKPVSPIYRFFFTATMFTKKIAQQYCQDIVDAFEGD